MNVIYVFLTMDTRKIVKAGPSSHTVSLPKKWLVKHKLGKGSTVVLIEQGAGVIITPDPNELKPVLREKTISVDNKGFDTIGRELASAYMNNYSTISFAGDDVQESAKELRKLLRDFAGLEIVEQGGKKLVAQDLLNLKEVSIDKTLRRMDMTIRSMFEDSIAGVSSEGIALRDYDINRMFFLVARLVRGSLQDSALAAHFGMTNGQLFESWRFAHALEGVADGLKNAVSLGLKQNDVCKSIDALYRDAVKAYFANDAALADAVAKKRDIKLVVAKTPAQTELNAQFRRILDEISTIALIVIDNS